MYICVYMYNTNKDNEVMNLRESGGKNGRSWKGKNNEWK